MPAVFIGEIRENSLYIVKDLSKKETGKSHRNNHLLKNLTLIKRIKDAFVFSSCLRGKDSAKSIEYRLSGGRVAALPWSFNSLIIKDFIAVAFVARTPRNRLSID